MDVFNLPWAGYFHGCIVRDMVFLCRCLIYHYLIDKRLTVGVWMVWYLCVKWTRGWIGSYSTTLTLFSISMVQGYYIYKKYSQLSMLGLSRAYLCTIVKMKGDDIVAAFFSTHMHVCSNFHEIILPCDKSKH